MARAARGVATTTQRAMVTATTWAMATATRVEGNEEGNGKKKGEGGKGNGDGNKGDGQAMTTTWAMATVTRWRVTKRVITRAARVIWTAMTMAGNKEGNGKEGKCNGNGTYNGRQ